MNLEETGIDIYNRRMAFTNGHPTTIEDIEERTTMIDDMIIEDMMGPIDENGSMTEMVAEEAIAINMKNGNPIGIEAGKTIILV